MPLELIRSWSSEPTGSGFPSLTLVNGILTQLWVADSPHSSALRTPAVPLQFSATAGGKAYAPVNPSWSITGFGQEATPLTPTARTSSPGESLFTVMTALSRASSQPVGRYRTGTVKMKQA